jgi:hypothetical protein
MGVERWLHQKLGKPPIDIISEVLTDLDTDEGVDWVNQDIAGSGNSTSRSVRARCDLALSSAGNAESFRRHQLRVRRVSHQAGRDDQYRALPFWDE